MATHRDLVVAAIEGSWARETAETPDGWDEANPASGHCDISAFVAWEHLGGDLVLGQVHLDGQLQEHHYWNRIDGVDIDLTRSQFRRGEVITEIDVLESSYLAANQSRMRPELTARITAFREAVNDRLGAA